MRIALDIDDTITRHTEFFGFLSRALVAGGHEVIIITFREDRNSATADLDAWGIGYTKLITSDLPDQLEHGVDEWKGRVCREHRVEILFDDAPEVLRHVESPTLCLMAIDHERHDLSNLLEPPL